MKKISLIFIALTIIMTFFNENTINVFAENYSKQFLSVGEIYKSGDVINIQEAPGCDFYALNSCKYRYSVDYIKFVEGYTYEPDDYYYYDYIEESFNSYSNDGIFTFEQLNGKDVYWQVIEVDENSYYGNLFVKVQYFDYNVPKLELECDKDNINIKESTTCELTLKYNYELASLDFDINSKLFEISNFKSLNGWEASQKTESYSLINDISGDTSKKDLTTVKIATFNLTASEIKDINNLKDDIIIHNIKYTDVITKGDINKITTTLSVNKPKVENKQEEIVEDIKIEEKVDPSDEIIENPPTGKKVPLIILSISLIIVYIFSKISKKYKYFEKL